MVQKAVQPQENERDNVNEEWEIEGENSDTNEAEFEAINAQLDQLNSALDNLEQKTDDIHAKLTDLLQSNREARKQFQESQKEQGSNPSKSKS